jgi:hypothetical protein
MFSSTSFAEWKKVGEHKGGVIIYTFYVDFERIRKHDGHVYFWKLNDYLKPIWKVWSEKTYYQGDCKLFRYKNLGYSNHEEPMGGGTTSITFSQDISWIVPSPNSSHEAVLKAVCDYVK